MSGRLAFAAAAFLALATPAASFEGETLQRLQAGARSAFALATDPAGHVGKQVTFTCLMTHSNIDTVICPVFNEAGAGVGGFPLWIREQPSEVRRRAANQCTDQAMPPACAAIVTAKLGQGVGLVFSDVRVEFVQP